MVRRDITRMLLWTWTWISFNFPITYIIRPRWFLLFCLTKRILETWTRGSVPEEGMRFICFCREDLIYLVHIILFLMGCFDILSSYKCHAQLMNQVAALHRISKKLHSPIGTKFERSLIDFFSPRPTVLCGYLQLVSATTGKSWLHRCAILVLAYT